MQRHLKPDDARRHATRGGVTLIELIVVVTIIVILVAITATAIRVNYDSDRIRAGARQMQSYLLGARDRAIHAKAPRGVRLILDPQLPNVATSMIYIEPVNVEPYNVEIYGATDRTLPISGTNLARRVELPINPSTGQVRPVTPDWAALDDDGLLIRGRTRIRIPADSRGEWYVIQDFAFDPPSGANKGRDSQVLLLSTEYRQPVNGTRVITQAQLDLPPVPLENEQPVQLPRGICVDLNRCGKWIYSATAPSNRQFDFKIPADWRIAVPPSSFSTQLDILFSPRGSVIGPAAATGIIQLYLTEEFAAEAGLDPSYQGGDWPVPDSIVTTIFTRTGTVITSPVNKTNDYDNSTNPPVGPPDNLADDPFYYSERGEVAGK
ncbi:MAG: prepilin-type N-terminal cleavage/methylation domain-containing protein [Planctomycetaceae bacterium]|nr:prepilin-type N-terminal cleavage/methylation domain-containing protein [Planctomycetaceae bacterium]